MVRRWKWLTRIRFRRWGFLHWFWWSGRHFVWRRRCLKRLKRSTEIFEENGLSIIPESISPYSQIPYNDFVFQVVPLKFYQNMVVETLKNEDFVLIYLNSWQFTDLEKHQFQVPFYRKYNSGRRMENKLEDFLQWMNENEFAFSRMKDFVF